MAQSKEKKDAVSDEPKKCLAALSKFMNFPRPSQDNVLYWYIPLAGSVSYTTFSLHIFNPDFLASVAGDSKHIVANSLLFNAHLGTGLYLFSRKHLACAPLTNRIMYSVYGSLIFNFGSILLWALTKVILPENSCIRGIFALSSSLGMILVGREYLEYVNSKTA